MNSRQSPRTKQLAADLIRRVRGWEIVEAKEDGASFRTPRGDHLVIASYAVEADKKVWLHVSVSRADGMIPTYTELCMAHQAFVGADRYSYQPFVPGRVHVNLHATCLHLFHCCDGNPIPEFSGVVDGVRTI